MNSLYFIFFLFIFCIPVKSTFSQQSNIWYFGEYAGLSFNTNPPTALTNGQLNTSEGCTSISDRNGNILFYTDGSTVYNRLHAIMPNGTGLLGGPSSTSSAIVIPKPGSNHIYYIFTAEPIHTSLNTTYAFSEVNMLLDGGLGDITSQKNIILYTPATERLAAVKHANGMDYWIVTKRFGDNSFLVYKVDCDGVNTTPVISNIGAIPVGQYDAIGAIKASPNGKKVCIAINGSIKAQLFDFDNTSGMLSNLIDLTGYSQNRIYGVEFSPNGKLLYVSTNGVSINQYDITSNNQAAINASRYSIVTAIGDNNQGLQLGPDKKIYVAVHSMPSLNVINNPDVYGIGCNMAIAGAGLNGRRSFWGLPSYISSFFNSNAQIDFTYSFNGCQVVFSGTTTVTGNMQWYWDFGDGTTGTGQTVNHEYSQLGNYMVRLKGMPIGDCFTEDSFVITHPVIIEQDTTKHVDFTYTFDNCEVQFSGTTDFSPNLQWYWDFGDGTTAIGRMVNHTYSRLGSYTVTLKGEPTENCILYDTMLGTRTINIANAGNTLDFTHSFTDCKVRFSGTTNAVNNLLWQWDFGDGNNASGKVVDHVYRQSGNYIVALNGIPVTNCMFNDTIFVSHTVLININNVTVWAGKDTAIFFDLPYRLNAAGAPVNVSYAWSPVIGLNNPFIANPITRLKNDMTYQATVTDENGCKATDDIFIKIFGNPEVYIPGSFTPNNDGLNDILKPLGFGLKKVVYFRIYNRYGQMVFETNNLYSGWDGTFKGKPQSAGTYTYMVKVINYRDHPVEQTGTSILIR